MPDFSFIASDHQRNMIENAYNAISIAEKWEFLKTFEPNPMKDSCLQKMKQQTN